MTKTKGLGGCETENGRKRQNGKEKEMRGSKKEKGKKRKLRGKEH